MLILLHRTGDEPPNKTKFRSTTLSPPTDQTHSVSPTRCSGLTTNVQRADDEALTRFLQTSLFLVASPILVKSMFLSFRSSLTLSIQVFLCLLLLLFPSTCPCKTAFGSLFSSILSTCPNHCSLLPLIFCITVSSAPSSSLLCSFLTFSLLLLPMILLSQLISATKSLRSSSFLRLQHSEPYSKTGTTRA